MSTAKRSNGTRIYRCLTCFAQVTAEPLEELVTDALVARLDAADLPDVDTLRPAVDLVGLEDQLAQLAADHGEGLIGRAEWIAARKPLLARIDTARSAAATASGAALVGLAGRGRGSKAWPDLTLAQRQDVLDAMIEMVSIRRATRRGPGLDPDRVDVRWRA